MEKKRNLNGKSKGVSIKQTDLSDIFGLLKGKIRMSGQKMKNLSRKEWDR